MNEKETVIMDTFDAVTLDAEMSRLQEEITAGEAAAKKLVAENTARSIEIREAFTSSNFERIKELVELTVATVQKELSETDTKYIPFVGLTIGNLAWAVRPEGISYEDVTLWNVKDDVLVFVMNWQNSKTRLKNSTRVDLPSAWLNLTNEKVVKEITKKVDDSLHIAIQEFNEFDKKNKEKINDILSEDFRRGLKIGFERLKERKELREIRGFYVQPWSDVIFTSSYPNLDVLSDALEHIQNNHKIDRYNYYNIENSKIITAKLSARIQEIYKIAQKVSKEISEDPTEPDFPNVDFPRVIFKNVDFRRGSTTDEIERIFEKINSQNSDRDWLVSKNNSYKNHMFGISSEWLNAENSYVEKEIKNKIIVNLAKFEDFSDEMREYYLPNFYE